MPYAIKAAQAFIYIRGEYAHRGRGAGAALGQAREAASSAPTCSAPATRRTSYLHRGAGAYICGEEMALLSRSTAPRPAERQAAVPGGRRRVQKPTLLNNVETHRDHARRSSRSGGEWYAKSARSRRRARAFFSLSGHVKRPGNYELPFTRHARRPDRGHRRRRAGRQDDQGDSSPAASRRRSCARRPRRRPRHRGAGRRRHDGRLGRGDGHQRDTCMVQLALRTAEFYRHESCGKCTPCREGTALDGRDAAPDRAGRGRTWTRSTCCSKICDNIEGKCLCPLGDACAMPVRSVVKRSRASSCARRGGRLPASRRRACRRCTRARARLPAGGRLMSSDRHQHRHADDRRPRADRAEGHAAGDRGRPGGDRDPRLLLRAAARRGRRRLPHVPGRDRGHAELQAACTMAGRPTA